MYICECGEKLDGLVAISNHNCVLNKPIESMSDGEIRQALIEIGVPNVGLEAMNYAVPTEMERIIFEEEREVKDIVIYCGSKGLDYLRNL